MGWLLNIGYRCPMIKESVTIKELSDENFKSTTHKIPICIGKDFREY